MCTHTYSASELNWLVINGIKKADPENLSYHSNVFGGHDIHLITKRFAVRFLEATDGSSSIHLYGPSNLIQEFITCKNRFCPEGYGEYAKMKTLVKKAFVDYLKSVEWYMYTDENNNNFSWFGEEGSDAIAKDALGADTYTKKVKVNIFE